MNHVELLRYGLYDVNKLVCLLFVVASADSTDSSGESVPVFSSDQSCLSAIGGEVIDSSSSFVSRRVSLCRTPSLRTNSSPALTRKSPAVVPKAPSLPNAQVTS